MFILFTVVGFLIESKSNFTDASGARAIALCAMFGTVFALGGLALVAIPRLVALTFRLARSRFR
jgi:hypothetical protein